MNKSIVGKYTLAMLVALVALADVASAAEVKKVRATGQACYLSKRSVCGP